MQHYGPPDIRAAVPPVLERLAQPAIPAATAPEAATVKALRRVMLFIPVAPIVSSRCRSVSSSGKQLTGIPVQSGEMARALGRVLRPDSPAVRI